MRSYLPEHRFRQWKPGQDPARIWVVGDQSEERLEEFLEAFAPGGLFLSSSHEKHLAHPPSLICEKRLNFGMIQPVGDDFEPGSRGDPAETAPPILREDRNSVHLLECGAYPKSHRRRAPLVKGFKSAIVDLQDHGKALPEGRAGINRVLMEINTDAGLHVDQIRPHPIHRLSKSSDHSRLIADPLQERSAWIGLSIIVEELHPGLASQVAFQEQIHSFLHATQIRRGWARPHQEDLREIFVSRLLEASAHRHLFPGTGPRPPTTVTELRLEDRVNKGRERGPRGEHDEDPQQSAEDDDGRQPPLLPDPQKGPELLPEFHLFHD